MVTNEVIINFFIIAGIAVALIVAIAWATRSVIVHEVNKRHDLFKEKLQMEVSRTLDQFRKSLAEEKMIFSAMKDSRSDSLVQMYGIMIDIVKGCRDLSKPGLNNLPFVVAIAQNFVVSIRNFYDVYQKNGIYFSDAFCSAMDTFTEEHEPVIEEIVASIGTIARNQQEEQQMITDIQKSWSTFEMRIPSLIVEMKAEFHSLISGSSRRLWEKI
jgi:hypothetical protein